MENEKKNRNSWIFTLAMAAALAAFIMASCGGTISGGFKKEAPAKKQNKGKKRK